MYVYNRDNLKLSPAWRHDKSGETTGVAAVVERGKLNKERSRTYMWKRIALLFYFAKLLKKIKLIEFE